MIYLLYQPEFNNGMAINIKTLRPIFDTTSTKALQSFLRIYQEKTEQN